MNLDAQANLRTLRDVLRFAVTRFNEAGLSYGHGQANAFEEAAFIILRSLKLPLDKLDFFADAYLTHAEINALLQLIDRRVKKRVPAAYLKAGTRTLGRPAGWGRERQEAFEATDYHQPSDELREDWDLGGAVEDAQLLFYLGAKVANTTPLPAWRPGDEFEAARKKALAELSVPER